jgi:CxxC motif-containing protein (DUF1111 family)
MCRCVCRSLRVWIVVASACTGGWLQAERSSGRPTDDPFAEEPAKSPTSQDSLAARVQRGREMFLKRWKTADVANVTGDGLGPVFNGRSCVECHNMARPGGAGSADHTVDLLSVVPQTPLSHDRKKFLDRITAIDPAFTAESASGQPNVTLHKFGTDPAYGAWRSQVLDIVTKSQISSSAAKQRGRETVTNETSMEMLHETGKPRKSSENKAAVEVGPPRADRLLFVLSHRSTPALFGAGLVDGIPDEVLRAAAKAQADRHNLVRGQVAFAGGGRAGKFGWRGQTATLKEFVMGACANELGLQVPGHNQGIDPLDPGYRAPGLDLTQEQCDDLSAFVGSLPRPEQRQPKDSDERDLWQAGEHVFETVGCANCHIRTLGSVEGLYSDLLLHDLGPTLADPVGTPSSESNSTPTSGGYNGGGQRDIFINAPAITRRQWRTPPLWGVADSAPYLHDGRAATLEEAIKDHGGEGSSSARLFATLPTGERAKLLAFLNSLAAPKETIRVAQD